MTKRTLILIALATAFSFPPAVRADLNRCVLEGRLSGAGRARAVSLRVLCNPDSDGGAISVELWVPQAFNLKDFDYDDFEGPDAAAGDRALSQVSVAGAGGTTEISSAAAGWYSGEDPDTFVFGLSQLSHHEGKIANLLRAIDTQRTQLVWIQTGFDNPKHELRATFALDAAMVQRLHDTVDVCLAPATRSTPAVKR